MSRHMQIRVLHILLALGITLFYSSQCHVAAQNIVQEPIYVPFGWDYEPLTASIIGSTEGTTSYALIDGATFTPSTPGPATLVQFGTQAASMYYVNSAAAAGSSPTTLSGACNLARPVAVCTLNFYETRSGSIPGPGSTSTSTTTTSRPGSVSTNRDSSAARKRAGPASVAGASRAGWVMLMSTVTVGFCVGLALLR